MQNLDKRIAYILDNPIRCPDDMPVLINTGEFDKEWENNIKDMWWYHKNKENPVCAPHIKFDERMFKLREKLLSFAGSEVCMPVVDEDLDEILSHGQIWYGDRIQMKLGRQSQCHRNSASLWNKNKEKYVLCTGYALTEDGMWRQHSWLVEPRVKKSRIIETPPPRFLYIGIGMNNDQAKNFFELNY